MKISNFKGSVSNLKVFKPIQYLNIVSDNCPDVTNVKLRVRVVNSDTGRVDEIIPNISLDVLGEICSMNEGFYISSGGYKKFNVNVMLHPTSAVYLSNDKYLEIDVINRDAESNITLYGIESSVVDKEFVCRYNKFYMSAGELQKTFAVGENENLIIPDESFDEVALQFKNGTTCTYLRQELESLMMMKNDIVCLTSRSFDSVPESSMPEYLYFGYRSMFGLDVEDVDNFTIKRGNSTSAFEIIMIDTLKD